MAAEDQMTLEDQLCFALYDASRAVMGQYRAGLAELGLTYTQYVVLLVLWADSEATVSSLGDRLNLDSGTLSPLLKRLEAQGLVRRVRSSTDERVVHVHLTQAGAALEHDVNLVRCEVEAAVDIEPGEMARLREQLHDLSARLRSAQG
ncbi:MarR family transcriptional regulator [Nocardioidaceae bacterium]|nr:MarR family transcriptional regulator [Nocardioidaceae bacterium]